MGADIGFHVGKNFLDEKPQQFYPAAIFKLMVDHNMLGEKTPSGGFYSFEKNKCAVYQQTPDSGWHAHVHAYVERRSGCLAFASMWVCGGRAAALWSTPLHTDRAVCGLTRLRTCVWSCVDIVVPPAAGVRGRPTPRSSRLLRRLASRPRCRPPTSWASAPRYRILNASSGAAHLHDGFKTMRTEMASRWRCDADAQLTSALLAAL